jgi:hypothetical protein
MADKTIQQFVSGVHNLIDNENIPQDAAQDAQNWYTLDGLTQLVNGRDYVGTEGLVGKITGEIFGRENYYLTVTGLQNIPKGNLKMWTMALKKKNKKRLFL